MPLAGSPLCRLGILALLREAYIVTGQPVASCTPLSPQGFVGCPPSNFCCGIAPCPGNTVNLNCRSCSSALDCNGNAIDPIPSDGFRCLCDLRCRNRWTEYDCSRCDYPYGGIDCDRCAVGLVGYPNCRNCTIAGDCSNNAVAVSSDGQVCLCTCRGAWAGADPTGRTNCGACPFPRGNGVLNDCDACVVNYYVKPDQPAGQPVVCLPCNSLSDCSGHNIPNPDGSVSSDGTNCCCTCRNAWQGEQCETCLPGYAGKDCDECDVDSYGVYPACYSPSIEVVGGVDNGTSLYRKKVTTSDPSTCTDDRTAVDWIVECGIEARREASYYYATRDQDTEYYPRALFFYADDTEAKIQLMNDLVPCAKKYWPAQLPMDPMADHHVEVCRVARVGGISAEYNTRDVQSCSVGVDWSPWYPTHATVDMNLSIPPTTLPWAGMTKQADFAVMWQGILKISLAGNHTFTLWANDGARLYIDGQLVVDNARDVPPTMQCKSNWVQEMGWMVLSAGDHTMVLRYFQKDHFSGMELTMYGATTCFQDRPLRFWETAPLPTYYLWRVTNTPTITQTPTYTNHGPCLVTTWSTVCMENEVVLPMLMPYLMFLCPLILLMVMCCCKCCRESGMKAATREIEEENAREMEKEEELDDALPDPDCGEGIHVSVRQINEGLQTPLLEKSKSPVQGFLTSKSPVQGLLTPPGSVLGPRMPGTAPGTAPGTGPGTVPGTLGTTPGTTGFTANPEIIEAGPAFLA